ncbi:MAG TPA: hypothetical protein PLE30_09460 [Candidatus Kapabacteria bacterium]|nr:hypothetical protein [Candidatus Kapabacteria bacterium]
MVKKIDLYQHLLEEDLSNDLKMLSELCGIDCVRLLMKNYSGLQFYIPKISSFRSVFIRIIQNESSSISNKDLASRLDVSEEFIRKIRLELKAEQKKWKNIN